MQAVLHNRATIMDAWPFVQDAMTPASNRQIGQAIEKLQVFCFKIERTAGEAEAWVEGFCDSLGRVPEDIILLACKRWRERKITSNTHPMPSPGQLMGMVDDVWGTRCAIYSRARMAVKYLRENPDAVPYVPHRDHEQRAKQIAGFSGKIGTAPKSSKPKPRSRDEQIRDLMKDHPEVKGVREAQS